MNNVFSLKNRTAIVTGAGSGIGRGTALALAAAGANVVIAARRRSTGDETAALIKAEGGSALCIEADVSRRVDIDRAVAETVQAFGGLHIVVHNANSGKAGIPTKLLDVTDELLRDQSDIALSGSFFLARAAFPHLRQHGQGRFIVLSSSQGATGGSMNPVYVAVKGAQRGFVRALAREWGIHGITVNAVLPASETDSAKAHFERNPHLRDKIYAQIPMRRLGEPRADIGEAIVALSTDAMRYVTGQMVSTDGGIITG